MIRVFFSLSLSAGGIYSRRAHRLYFYVARRKDHIRNHKGVVPPPHFISLPIALHYTTHPCYGARPSAPFLKVIQTDEKWTPKCVVSLQETLELRDVHSIPHIINYTGYTRTYTEWGVGNE
jgi:hypothetical protein